VKARSAARSGRGAGVPAASSARGASQPATSSAAGTRAQAVDVHGGAEEGVVAPLGGGVRQREGADRLAEARRRLHPLGPLLAEAPLEHLPQAADHEGRPAVRGDGELHRAALDPGGQVEGAELGVVGDVHPDAGLARLREHPRVGLAIVGRGEDEREPRRVPRPPAAPAQLDGAAALELGDGGDHLGGDDARERPLREHALELAERDLAPPHHEDAPTA
jgi:hypothetical protein